MLKERLTEITEEKLKDKKLSPTLNVDMELDLKDLTFDLYQELSLLEPFGEGNPQPVFASRDAKIVEVKTVGASNQHLKFRLISPSLKLTFDAIGFGLGHLYNQLSPEKNIDVAYNLTTDEWNGNHKLQLKIKDIQNGKEI